MTLAASLFTGGKLMFLLLALAAVVLCMPPLSKLAPVPSLSDVTIETEGEIVADMNRVSVKIHDATTTMTALQCLESHGAFRATEKDGLIQMLCMDPEDPAKTVYDVVVRQVEKTKYTLNAAYRAGDGTLQSALNAISKQGWSSRIIPAETFKVTIK